MISGNRLDQLIESSSHGEQWETSRTMGDSTLHFYLSCNVKYTFVRNLTICQLIVIEVGEGWIGKMIPLIHVNEPEHK